MLFARLIRKAKENIAEMGQTGTGITSEDEIQPGTSFATKWGEFSVLAADHIDAH
jgi:hypothetical protein